MDRPTAIKRIKRILTVKNDNLDMYDKEALKMALASLESDKYVAMDDIIARYMFHAEEKARHEISQILREVRKYSTDEISATKREKEK